MPQAARLGDSIVGITAGEHSNHEEPHPPLQITGRIVNNVSSNVFINGLPAAHVGSVTMENDACCGTSYGSVATGSSSVYINGIPASRLGDALSVHNPGSGIVDSGSPNVFIG